MDLKDYKAKEEFKYIIEKYILILLGFKDNNLQMIKTKPNNLKDLISFHNDYIFYSIYG